MRMFCSSSTLRYSLMLTNCNSQCYNISSKRTRNSLFRSLLFSILLDIVLECNLEDTDHPSPTTMNVQVFSYERKTDETLILKKVSRLVWKYHGVVKVYVSFKPRY